MKHIETAIYGLLVLIAAFGCSKTCDDSLRVGEMVEIPVEFVGFTLPEINNMVVYRVDKSNSGEIDTILMRDLLWAKEARSNNETITDHSTDNLGYYSSYLDNCHLILDWHTGKDTLSDFVIKKSKALTDDCHKNDPNVRIDQLSFMHQGKMVSKNEGIQVNK